MHAKTLIALALFAFGCDGAEDPDDTGADGAGPAVAPTSAQSVEAGGTANYTVTGLDDTQAYRITLVVEANISPTADGGGLFLDADADGAADAGLSENIALITAIDGAPVTGAKTVPASTDDPAAPTGVFPSGGQITLTVTGVGAGTVHPVAYENGGASTFLEIDAASGEPSEVHAVGGALTVTGSGGGDEIAVSPSTEQTVAVDGMADYTVTGLDDAQAYRVTLVLAENLTLAGVGGTFLDLDLNGAADPGLSEAVANIVTVNGAAVTGAKTVPSGEDDPAAPSGVYPAGGEIALEVMGIAPGAVYPVAYPNAGASTFLELDAAGSPVEAYAVGGLLTVE